MPEFRITPNARASLKDIARHTLRKWGREQRDRYLNDLDKRFSWLANRPGVGRNRSDIAEGYYCFPQGSHLVFFVLSDVGIDIIDVVHQDMDIINYFSSS